MKMLGHAAECRCLYHCWRQVTATGCCLLRIYVSVPSWCTTHCPIQQQRVGGNLWIVRWVVYVSCGWCFNFLFESSRRRSGGCITSLHLLIMFVLVKRIALRLTFLRSPHTLMQDCGMSSHPNAQNKGSMCNLFP